MAAVYLFSTTGKRYTYNGQTKSFGYTYQKGGIGETTTYPNGASRKQFLGHLAQVCKSTLTLPGGNTSTVEYGLYSPAPKAVAFARQHRNTPVLRKAKTISDKMVDKQLGWAMQRIGMMTPYYISVSYGIRW